MMNRCAALLLGLLVVSTSALDKDVHYFFKPEYKTGATYVQSSVLHQTSTVNVAGQDMEQTMDMVMTNEMSVSDLDEGGKEITLTYTHIQMDMSAMGMKMSYDSNDDDGQKKNDNANNPFAMVGGLVGEPIKVIVDDDYNVVRVESPSKDSLLASLQANEATKDLASAKQLEQTTTIMRSLPEIGVKEGDVWDFDLDLDADMVHFAGQGKLVEYTDCPNHEEHQCAHVQMDGTMDMHLDKVGDALGNKQGSSMMKDMMKQMKVTEGTMSTTIEWDVDDMFARTTELTTDMVMQMNNPVDNSVMEIPIHQSVKVTMDMME